MVRFPSWLRLASQQSSQQSSRGNRRRQKAPARVRPLRLEWLEDRRLLAYNVTETGSAGDETLVFTKAVGDTAALTMTADVLGDVTLADPNNTFAGGTFTGVTINANSVVVDPTVAGVVHFEFDFSANNSQANNFTVGNLNGSTIPGFDVLSKSGSSDVVTLSTGTIDTSSSTAADASINLTNVESVVITTSVTIKTAQLVTDNPGAVNFGGAVVSAAATAEDLTIDTSASGSAINGGNVTIAGLSNGAGQYVNSFSITTTPGATATSGAISLSSGIETVEAQTYNGPVIISNSVRFTSGGTGASGAITFDSTVDGTDGNEFLIVDTAGLTDFKGAVGGSASAPTLASVDIDSGPAQIEGGSVATNDLQMYNGAVAITQNTTFTALSLGPIEIGLQYAIEFGSTVDGSGGVFSLTITTTNTTTFLGSVGGSAGSPDISTLTVSSGPTQIGQPVGVVTPAGTGPDIVVVPNPILIATSGNQVYADVDATLSISVDTTLASGGYVSLASQLVQGFTSAALNGNNLTMTATGGVLFRNVAGSQSNTALDLGSITINGPTYIGSPFINTIGAQTYNGPVVLVTNTSIASVGVGAASGPIAFNSTVDSGSTIPFSDAYGAPAALNFAGGLTVSTNYSYTNVAGSPQLFGAAVGGLQPLAYLVANVRGGILLAEPITTAGDMLFGGSTIMPAVLQVSTNLTSTAGTIGFNVSQQVYTGIGSVISSPDGTISFAAGTGSTGASLISLYSTMVATGVFVAGNGGSNQLELPPAGQDTIVDEYGINSGIIGSYQGVNASGAAVPPLQYTNEQNIALNYWAGTQRASTLSIFTAGASGSNTLTNTIYPIASFNPTSTSSPANAAGFYLEDTDITTLQVRVGRGNQVVDASRTNANAFLEGDAYRENHVTDTLMGGHNTNVLIGGQSQATLVAGDGAGATGPTVANYIFTHYEYTVGGGVGHWEAVPVAGGDTVNGSGSTQNSSTTNDIVTNGSDRINASGFVLTNGQATISGRSKDTFGSFTQANVNTAQEEAIEALFPDTNAPGVFANGTPPGTTVTSAIAINYSPTPVSQSSPYAAPPVFYIPAYVSGATPLLVANAATGDMVHVDYNSNDTQFTISADEFSQTFNVSLISSIEVAAFGDATEVSVPLASTQAIGALSSVSTQAYVSISQLDSSAAPPLTIAGAKTLTLNNNPTQTTSPIMFDTTIGSELLPSTVVLVQTSDAIQANFPSGLVDGSAFLLLNNYASNNVAFSINQAHP